MFCYFFDYFNKETLLSSNTYETKDNFALKDKAFKELSIITIVIRNLTVILALLFTFFSCKKQQVKSAAEPNWSDNNSQNESSRSFYMGFTPWLYAATAQAETDVYHFINTNGDIVAHHFQQGIPYNSALTFPNFSNYETNIQNEINNRVNLTENDKKIYLAIDSLNSARNDLTDFWGTSANTSRPSPWDSRSFNHNDVITAYKNFSLELIARFNPTYFNYGSEISDLMLNSPAKFSEFVTFASQIYSTIKAYYPNLKLMVSIALKTPNSSQMQTVKSLFSQIKDYVDIVGISTYGYAFYSHVDKGDPDNLPSNWLSQIKEIAPDKEYAIVETGWIGENLSIPAYSLNVQSDEEKQKSYLEKLFKEANSINAKTIIWFSSYDYDTLWSDTLGSDNVSKIWKDTGIFDENLNERSSLDTWKKWFNYTKK